MSDLMFKVRVPAWRTGRSQRRWETALTGTFRIFWGVR